MFIVEQDCGGFFERWQASKLSKKTDVAHVSSEKVEKTTLKQKDQESACAKNSDPYNAPPSRRNSESLHELPKTIREKILNLGVDSERGKRIIRILELASESV